MLKRKSKRVLSIVLAVAMIVGLFPIAAFADDGTAGAKAKTISVDETTTTLASAVSEAKSGDTIQLATNIELDAQVSLPEGVTLDGQNYTISIKDGVTWSTDNSSKYMILADKSNVAIKNVTMDAENNAYGCIQFYATTDGKVENVTLKNAQNLGLMVNASTVTATGTLALDGNGWGDVINVGWGKDISGVTSCSLNVSSATLVGVDSIYADAGDVERANSATSSGDGKTPITITTPAGLVPVSSGDKGITYVPTDSSAIVAIVNDADGNPVRYSNLQAAITAAKDNGTVTLVNNVYLTDGVEVEDGSTVTLDLNGYTITDKDWAPTDSADYLLAVKRGGNLKINDSSADKTGAITTTNESIVVAVKLTIKGESTEENAKEATLTVNGGTLKAPAYGISGNGTRHNTNLTINGGTIEGTKGTGIYQPQDGTVTINGGTITGLNTGLEIRSGKLTVKGGTFISTATEYAEEANGNGTTVSGAALAISQHTTAKNIDVTIDGGTFRGPRSFVETDVQGEPTNEVKGVINNGTFIGEVSSDDFTNFVKGGQFSAPVVTKLLDDSLTAQLQSTSNTTAPYSYYTSVEAAIAAAQPGDKVVDLTAAEDATTYTVTIKYNNGDKDLTLTVPKNMELTLPAAPSRADYTFDGWIINGEKYAAGVKVKITANTEISADWQPPYTGKYSYEIFTKVGENGTISVDRYATEGDDVTIAVSPDEAYLLDELTVTTGGKEIEVKDNGDGTYTFKMPSADAKIVVTFAEDPDWEPEPEEPAMPFTDVNENDWFYDVVLYAYDNGLMTGVSATEFAPNQTTTRGMIVSMLARLEGVTSAEDAGFADVADNDWYATAVNWAASVGVVNGYEDNTFRPNAPITREQMAAILYNYADYKGYDVSARADLSDYADAASISSWAEDVLAWANAEGLINGMTATTIDPQGATTRAQTAAMFERFLTAHEA